MPAEPARVPIRRGHRPLMGAGTIIAAVVGVGAALGGCYALAVRRQHATLDCELLIEPTEPRFNEPFRVQVNLLAKRRCPLTRGTLTVQCLERAINRAGTSDTTYTHQAFVEARPIEVQQDLGEGLMWSLTETFQLPEGLPASFQGRNNFIEWSVVLHLGVRGPALDVRRSVPLMVHNEIV